ncbi:outer membrane beta-barrel family protein [uncultured Bacteroides sp.]|uniref:outer membrane beta-barrel family protein n=1 Tax=uncultured Bacteroides sp. TaxID=162156 RepID=UPI002AA7B6FD|nr:outer membrane beta-barrel family protein [uncultured Bacteroides sp.]
MCRIYFWFMLSFLVVPMSIAQSVVSVSGRVRIEHNIPAEGATISVIAQRDSSFICGTVADSSGQFFVGKLTPADYLLRISMVGYVKQYLSVHLQNKQSLNLGEVQLRTDVHQLSTVLITAQAPPVELHAAKMTINVGSSALRSQGSMYDALLTLPGVVVNGDGDVFLNGQRGVSVLIDGKQTYLSGQELVSLLKSTPASSGDKIDLITHPSSRYDASGNSGIIDIHMKKLKIQGENLSFYTNYSQGKYGKGSGGFSFNRREGFLNLYLDYSYYQGKDFNNLKIDRASGNPIDADDPLVNQHQSSYRKFSNTNHYLRTGADFYISPSTTLGVSAYVNSSDNGTKGTMNSYFRGFSQQPDSTLGTRNISDKSRLNYSAGVTFSHRIDTLGKSIDASFDYLYYNYTEKQKQYNSYTNRNGVWEKGDTLRGDMNGGIDLYTAQINLNFPVNKQWSFYGGLKSSFVSIDNAAGYDNAVLGQWRKNDALSHSFIYDENINAAYIQCDAKWNRLSLEAGLRLENTQISGRQSGEGAERDSSFSSNYTRLFPTILLQYGLPSNSSLSVSYGRRIVRPNYGDLNPFIYIHDKYTYEQGNTKLKPEMSDNIELSYIFRGLIKTTLFFTHTDDVIAKSYFTRENKRVYISPENLSSAVSAGVRLGTGNISLAAFWEINTYASFMYNNYHWSLEGQVGKNKRITPIGGLTNMFKLGGGYSAELTVSYNGRMAYGQAILHPMCLVGASIQRKIFKEKGTMQLYARDIFASYRNKTDILTNAQTAYACERQDYTMVGFSFSYRLSKGHESKDLRRKNSIDESKRINL